MKKKRLFSVILAISIVVIYEIYLSPDNGMVDTTEASTKTISYNIEEIPEYNGEAYITINDNNPYFTEEEIKKNDFEEYGDLDNLGRCTYAYAMISKEMMPTKERESIGSIKPSGWQISKYDFIEGKYLYNRCHLIGYQLTGENANPNNLITCTRFMNASTMVIFENKVSSYIKRTGNHVLYRVTPIFKDTELIARGVLMEAYSIEDNGKGIKFNVFVYNVQDNIVIDYQNGNNYLNKESGE